MIAAAAGNEMRARVLCVRADADAATELAASIGADVAVVEPGDALLRHARAADGSACLVILVSPQLVADVWPRRTFELIGRSLGNRASALAREVEDSWLRRHAPSLTLVASSAELVTWIDRLRRAPEVNPGIAEPPGSQPRTASIGIPASSERDGQAVP